MAQQKNRRAASLNVSLPMEMAQAVYDQVRKGAYPSASEFVREAVRQLLEREEAAPAEPSE